MKKIDLVIIDPQYDFCNPSGALYVKGAEKDMERLATLINRIYPKLDNIHVTLDCHHLMDLAHPDFWVDSVGQNPAPFTVITSADIKNGKYRPSVPSADILKRMIRYVESLEKSGRYPFVIWPPHCLIGTEGATVVPEVMKALNRWAKGQAKIDFITKGSNIFTEHYSAVRAEVPDPQDPGTMINTCFIESLMNCDEIAIAGETGSHCLKNTVEDIVSEFKDDAFIKKFVLLEGCFSPVPTFEKLQDDFVKAMMRRGMRMCRAKDYLG